MKRGTTHSASTATGKDVVEEMPISHGCEGNQKWPTFEATREEGIINKIKN